MSTNCPWFYDYFMPKIVCERYHFAVGYRADQINSSDFSMILAGPPPLCISVPYVLEKVEVSRMDCKDITFHPSQTG